MRTWDCIHTILVLIGSEFHHYVYASYWTFNCHAKTAPFITIILINSNYRLTIITAVSSAHPVRTAGKGLPTYASVFCISYTSVAKVVGNDIG